MLIIGNETTSIDKDSPRVAVHKETQKSKPKEAAANYWYAPTIYYPEGTHLMQKLSISGDEVETEDGAVWKISRYDAYKTFSWAANDPLIITQNHRWFSKYNYRIINQVTGESLESNLSLGPYINGTYTNYVTGLDHFYGYVFLSNGTRFRVSTNDLDILDTWNLDDPIIIGSNSGYDSSCSFLLINTVRADVRAEQF